MVDVPASATITSELTRMLWSAVTWEDFVCENCDKPIFVTGCCESRLLSSDLNI